MKNIFRNPDGEVNTQIVVAAIGAAATLLAALIVGIFGLIQLQASRVQPPPATPSAQLSVEIDGPTEAPLNEETWFTILSDAAVRAEWTIPDFGRDDINPFRQVDQIFVQPIDAERVGDSFTLVVTVYDAGGNRATARHEFQITDAASP
ncbi:MAG TPA: hypothetical protein PKE20_09820 [Promineifilum sp.]|nr:hypothetical protein [Promineifilum sp.]